jgi:hypothetical protein
MTQINRFKGAMALSVAAAAWTLAGCGADTAPTQQTPQAPVVPFIQAGTGAPAPKPAPTGIAGTGATPITTTPPVTTRPPVATAGVGAVAGTQAPVVPPATGTAGTAAVVPTTPAGEWDPKANLDANGVLIAPAAGQGFQWATPMFDLQPGQELYKCLHVSVPTDTEFPVGEWDSQMSTGSHHFILYRTAGDTAADGTLSAGACTQGFGGTTWLYTAGSPRGHLTFPEGVAMTLAPKERVTFDLHYINTTSQVIHARVALNANKVKAANFVKAGAQVSFNIGINVPAHGTQTVGGDCTPVAGAKYFLMQTHSHRYTTAASVHRKLANGMLGEALSESTNWEQPEVRVWMKEPFLTFQSGEKFAYSCSYKNDTNSPITVGISAEKNEMCMAEAYFFPFNGGQPACN